MSLKCSSSSSLLRVLFSSLAGLSSFSVFVSWSDTISKCFHKYQTCSLPVVIAAQLACVASGNFAINCAVDKIISQEKL